jgi:Fic family protein
VEVQARRRGHQTYYYLSHSFREAGQIRKVERYLGKKLPTDLAAAKAAFSIELASRQSSDALDRIGERFRRNQRKLPASLREKELESFAIQFTYDSNRIEGSSLTLRETGLLILDGITPSNRPLSDVRESLAHQRVFLAALRSAEPLTLETLLEWHREMFVETKPQLAGVIRTGRVRISGSKFEPPLPVELELPLREFFDWYRIAWKTLHPVVLAALVHFRLVSIHPFGDGNGRVTRLAMNFVLHRKRFPMFDIPYERRAGYYRALEKSHVTEDEGTFLRWFIRRYLAENTGRLSRYSSDTPTN